MHLLLGFLLIALIFGWVNAITTLILVGVLWFMAVHPAIAICIVVVFLLHRAVTRK